MGKRCIELEKASVRSWTEEAGENPYRYLGKEVYTIRNSHEVLGQNAKGQVSIAGVEE